MTLLPPIVNVIKTRGQLWLRSDEDLVRRTIAAQISELETLTHNHTLQPPNSPTTTHEAPSPQHSTISISDTTSPTFSADRTTFAYQQALRNRIPGHSLNIGGSLDIYRHHPLFIYDILQFPGSLANVLDNDSSLDMVASMTPGRLHRRSLHADRVGQPLLVDDDATAAAEGGCVRGMVVFGRGREDRECLCVHYGDGYAAELVYVDVLLHDGVTRTVPAYVWVRQRVGEGEEEGGVEGRIGGLGRLRDISGASTTTSCAISSGRLGCVPHHRDVSWLAQGRKHLRSLSRCRCRPQEARSSRPPIKCLHPLSPASTPYHGRTEPWPAQQRDL